MNKDKILNGYYQTNITTSRGENITYTTEYAIDKLQQENERLKKALLDIKEQTKMLNNADFVIGNLLTYSSLIEKIVNKALEGNNDL